VLVQVSVACGYSFVRYGGDLGSVHSVAVRTPRNESFEPGIEYTVAEALRNEFLQRGAVDLSDDPERADLVLSGSVASVETSARSFSSVVPTLEYQLTLQLELQATRADGSELEIGWRALQETERYLASADVEATRKNRDEALRRLATLLAGRVHDQLARALEP
jgi:hypothetical protein